MPERVQGLRDAAQARHDATLRRAENTVQHLAAKGTPVTFRQVAELAGVSRSWLYRQHELRQKIDQLRGGSVTSTRARIPSAQRANTDSLRQQIHTYRAEITRLRTENHALREQLARRLGTERIAAMTNPPDRRQGHVHDAESPTKQ